MTYVLHFINTNTLLSFRAKREIFVPVEAWFFKMKALHNPNSHCEQSEAIS